MTLYSLAGDKDVSLKANNLYAYSGDKLGDDYDDFAELGYIQGQTLNFEVLGRLRHRRHRASRRHRLHGELLRVRGQRAAARHG